MVWISNIIQLSSINTLKTGVNTLSNVPNSQGCYGSFTNRDPQSRRGDWLIHRLKDGAPAEFPFLSISHKLSMNVKKEIAMSTIAFAVILLVRIILPFSLLLGLGEWVRRREANYWLRR
jgi:hypothetical protein